MTDIEAWLQTHTPTRCPPAIAAPTTATLPPDAVIFHSRRYAEQQETWEQETPRERRARVVRQRMAAGKRRRKT